MGDKKKKKSNTWKWVLGGCLIMLFLFVGVIALGGYMLFKSFTTDPAAVKDIANEILPMETPEGVSGQFGFSMFGVKMAFLASSRDADEGMAIALMSFPDSVDRDQMEQEMKNNMKEGGRDDDRTVVEKKENETFKVRDKDVEASVQITADDKGEKRAIQYTMVVDGKDGKPAFLMIVGPEADVNHDSVQALLSTVK